MNISNLISECLPFAILYILQMIRIADNRILTNMLKILTIQEIELSDEVKDISVKLASQFYTQISFILSILISSVTLLSIIPSVTNYIYEILLLFIMLVIVLLYIIRWQSIASSPLDREDKDKEMKYTSLCFTSLMLIIIVLQKNHIL